MFSIPCGRDVAVTLNPEKRYRLTVSEAVRLERVWGLWDGREWAVFQDEWGHPCTPLWPCEECAKSWSHTELEGFVPRNMGLDCLVDRWLTVTANKGGTVAVFPVGEDRGYIVNPMAMFHDLLEELDIYEHV